MTLSGKKVRIFKAMAHPVRLAIVEGLAGGGRCVCDIAGWFNHDRTTISKHLSILKNAGIITDRKEGLSVYYSLHATCLIPLLECLETALRDDVRREYESCCGVRQDPIQSTGGKRHA